VTDLGRDGDPRVICELGRGQTAGEMGILTGRKRTATVSAIRDTLVAKLSTEAFSRLLQKHPQNFVKHFGGKVIDRLWLQTVGKSRDANSVVNIAIIPTEEGIGLTEFSLRLAKSLSAYGCSLHLNSERFDAYLSSTGIAQTPASAPHSANIACWLNRQESVYRYILYQADARASEWTKRCLRQADRILLAGNAAPAPHKGEIEQELLMDPRYRHLPQSLVILHDTSGPYNGTDAWLGERNLRCHYHVCLGDDEDITRLGRLLSGKGIGLVLSGGGARGFAHIGAIRALREVGIAIDKVGGTSIGSIVAAMAAMRWDYPSMLEQARSFNYRMDYTYPAVA
ncbi:MAG: cyclic nucleotide-binding and patatin-like phospholipase domain-containing protein, partial [Gammaproteobacteria bacterium]